MVAKNTGKKTRHTGVPKAQQMKKIVALKERGFSGKQIAEQLGISERYVWTLLKGARLSGDAFILEIPDPKPREALEPAVLECLEFTPEGFEKFFNRYSGRTLQPIHKQWVDVALSGTRILINCPPRHAKSTIFSVWFPIWLVAIDRNVQILIVSQTEKLAKKFTNEISNALGYNQQLIKDLGRFKPDMADWPWRPNSGELMVDGRTREVKSGDLSIQIRGSGQQILGMEANWIIADDVVDRPTVRSETERSNLSQWFHGDVMSRLEPGSHALVIGQRLHIHDLYGELAGERVLDIPRWKHINFPAVLDWDKQAVLWPAKWTFLALMDVLADVGSQNFESMYQQNPLPEGERLARTAWVYGDAEHPGCLDLDRSLGEGVRHRSLTETGELLEGESPYVRVLSLDPSPTRYAGLIVADVQRGESNFSTHILEIQRDKMSVRDMLNHINRVKTVYAPLDYIIFEQNAAQRWLLQEYEMDKIRQEVGVIGHSTGRNKGDPVLGVQSLALDFEFGRIRLPYGDAESKARAELLIKEAMEYPQSATDDLLMALWFIKFNYRTLVPRGNFYKKTAQTLSGFHIPPRLQNGYK